LNVLERLPLAPRCCDAELSRLPYRLVVLADERRGGRLAAGGAIEPVRGTTDTPQA
jgi:hypothetical protein